MAKQTEDTKTAELPGLKRRGRPPAGGVAMTAAERQKAYRLRKAQELFDPMTEMSRVTILKTLSQALERFEDEAYEFREGAEVIAEQAIAEIVTRYQLDFARIKRAAAEQRVTK